MNEYNVIVSQNPISPEAIRDGVNLRIPNMNLGVNSDRHFDLH